MEIQGKLMPGYRVYEYMLIINPHTDLQDRIKSVRASFDAAFKIETKIGGRANLGLVQWVQYAAMERRQVEKLKWLAMEYYPFKVELRNFGSYPSHSIYVNMVSRVAVKQLVKQIREQAGSLMKLNKETKPHFFDDPNILVARKLKPWQYEKGWLEYSTKHFQASFIADSMLMLKRADNHAPWQILERFEFANLAVTNTVAQGQLF